MFLVSLSHSGVFLCVDFNAHHVSCGCSRSSPQALYEASLGYDLISINNSCPTYVPSSGASLSNIDLILYPLFLSHLAKVEVVADPFGSDHLPLVLELASAVTAVPKPSCRINIKEVQWTEFHERIEGELPRLNESLWSGVPPSVVYDDFIRVVLGHLLELGATRRDGSTKRRKLQPLWWSKECENKIR